MTFTELEISREHPPYREVCPAVIVSAGASGQAVARTVVRLAEVQWDALPLVRDVRVDTSESPEEHAREIVDALRSLHHLELMQAVRRRGWTLRHRDGIHIFVLAPLGEPELQQHVHAVLTLLQVHLRRLNAGAPVLIGVLLREKDALPTEVLDSGSSNTDPAILGPSDFTGGCYVVETTNVYGLAFADPQGWTTMIAHWINDLLSTPLGASVAALPGDVETNWCSFGLARWDLPVSSLLRALTHRWQIDLLAELLRPLTPAQSVDVQSPLLSPPPPWQTDVSPSPFGSQHTAWTWPGLTNISTLRTALDEVLEEAFATLDHAARDQEQRLHRLSRDRETTLVETLIEILDTPDRARLAAALQWLATTLERVEEAVERAQQQIFVLEDQLADAEDAQSEKGQALDAASARFPPWTLRTWFAVLLRPWHWPRLALSYLRIRKRVRAYLTALEHVWLLHLRIHELSWRMVYWDLLRQALLEHREQSEAFCHALLEVKRQLTAAEPDAGILQTQLEQAALPADLPVHLYQRGGAAPHVALQALLATSPTLSDFLNMEQDGASYLLEALGEQAHERFEFVQYLRLDELLMRTYGATELRTRLTELLETAGPFCSYDPTRLTSDARADSLHVTWLGLPNGEASPLIDLLGEGQRHIYTAKTPGTITAARILTGLPDDEITRGPIEHHTIQIYEEEVSDE